MSSPEASQKGGRLNSQGLSVTGEGVRGEGGGGGYRDRKCVWVTTLFFLQEKDLAVGP